MPISLICACGARIELEDALAGQEIACPECQQPLKAPAGSGASQPVQTSGFALASLVLAITGAFTVVGTLAAIVLGLVAIGTILYRRERVAGLGYAIAGIAIGVVFTALTVLALAAGEPLGFTNYWHEREMAPYVDTTGPTEVVKNGWAITRPSETWGVAANILVADEFAKLFLVKSTPDLLLVQIKQHGYLDVLATPDTGKKLESYMDEYLADYQSQDDNPWVDQQGKEEGLMRVSNGKFRHRAGPVSAPPGCTARDAEMDVTVAGQPWVMKVRIFHNAATKEFYIVRAYTPRRHFAENKNDFEKAMDSFRIVP
jgi:hypothetical protein